MKQSLLDAATLPQCHTYTTPSTSARQPQQTKLQNNYRVLLHPIGIDLRPSVTSHPSPWSESVAGCEDGGQQNMLVHSIVNVTVTEPGGGDVHLSSSTQSDMLKMVSNRVYVLRGGMVIYKSTVHLPYIYRTSIMSI